MKPLFFSCLVAVALFGQQNTVFRRNVFQGITTAQASAAMPNIGQAVHIFTLIYPAAVADVTSFTFRVEASYDNTTYFPISEDITEAKYNGSFAYAISRCNGVYPYVRFRLVTANASNALTAHYTGSLQPIGIVKFQTDRYVAQSPLAGPTVEGLALNISGEYYVYGRRMTPIVTTDWTSVNLTGTTTRTDQTGAITIDNGANNRFEGVCRSLPAAPYVIRAHFIRRSGSAAGDNLNQTGIALRNNSSGLFVIWYWETTSSFRYSKWNSFAAANSDYFANPGRDTEPITSIQWTDDNTNRDVRIWDGFGAYKIFVGTQETKLRTDFVTPDQVCFLNNGPNGNYRTRATLVGYDVNPTW